MRLILFTFVLLYINRNEARSLSHDRRFLGGFNTIAESLINKFQFDNRRLKNELLLFPDVAYQSIDNKNIWQIIVHGWKYRSSIRKEILESGANLWLQGIAQNFINKNDLSILNGSIPMNDDRLRTFFVTGESNEILSVRFANETRIMRTDSNGEFYEKIQIDNQIMQNLKRNNGSLTYEVLINNKLQSNGTIWPIDPMEGISVISDVDDTIKISEVLDKVRLLLNTFIFPPKPVPGMSDLYRKWKAKYPDCMFHYLSAMPDQLYSLTQEFVNTNDFPDGSFHMRHFSWTLSSIFNFLHSQSTFDHKIRYLNFFLLNTKRSYVLVGDSGEKDPEIYGTIAREYPERIRVIFIRAIKGESSNDQRFLDAFQGIPQSKWRIFDNPEQLPIDL